MESSCYFVRCPTGSEPPPRRIPHGDNVFGLSAPGRRFESLQVDPQIYACGRGRHVALVQQSVRGALRQTAAQTGVENSVVWRDTESASV